MIEKINLNKNIVEIDGDEMAKIMWSMIKEKIISPYVNLDTEYYDLSIKNRNDTNDEVTIEAAKKIKDIGIGIKCATITPTNKDKEILSLKRIYKSPNGTIRNIIGGTIFREPIYTDNYIKPVISTWKKNITIARHGFGDQYISHNINVNEGDKIYLEIQKKDKSREKILIKNFDQKGVFLSMFNLEQSIKNFATSCFEFALDKKQDLYFAAKHTILQNYDSLFKDIFADLYKYKFEKLFIEKNIKYEYKIIDDMISFCIKSEGGFIFACKNYDGDIMSDLIAQGFGSVGLMTSTIFNTKDQIYLMEAAHGTVHKHYKEHLKGNVASTNPIASIFVWANAFEQLGKKNNDDRLVKLSYNIKKSCIETVKDNYLTKDLAMIKNTDNFINTEQFIEKISTKLKHINN